MILEVVVVIVTLKVAGGKSPLEKSRDWEVAVIVCRQSSWLGLSLSDHIKEKNAKEEKVYLLEGWQIGVDMLWGWLSYHFQARLRLGMSLSSSETRAGDDRHVVGQARARSGRCRLVIAQSLGSSLTSLGKVGSRGDCVLVASEKAGARESS